MLAIDKPKFGTVEYELLCELQKELCRAHVHMARRGNYRSYSMSIAEMDGCSEIDDEDSFYREMVAKANDRQLASALSTIEDEGLLSALGRMRRLMAIAKRKGLIPIEIGADIEALSGPIKEIRDMREHYDAYIQGKGDHPNKFVRSHTFENGSVFSSNAKWSVQVGAEEMLGCRLKVMDVAKAIGALRKQIEEARLWVLPWKATDLARRGSETLERAK